MEEMTGGEMETEDELHLHKGVWTASQKCACVPFLRGRGSLCTASVQ